MALVIVTVLITTPATTKITTTNLKLLWLYRARSKPGKIVTHQLIGLERVVNPLIDI